MKRTKSMIYKETPESIELLLYTTNDGRIYERSIRAAILNLQKKMKKGLYDPDKAVDLWYYIADAGSKAYYKDFGYSFNVQDRFTVAVELERRYREEVEEILTA